MQNNFKQYTLFGILMLTLRIEDRMKMKKRIIILGVLCAVLLSASAQSKGRKRVVAKPKDATTLLREKQEALFEEMLDNTRETFVVDSVVVDADKAIEAINIPADLGRMVAYNDVFNDKQLPGTYAYLNGLGNKCWYAECDTTGSAKVYCREKLGGKWSARQQVSGIGDELTHINYPFMTSDGETFYFAAKSTDGLGGYDLYVTRYDADEGQFLAAENVGLPFNSFDDDLIYAEDDVHGFAWLVSNRRQPEGKACVYIIKTAEKRTNYDSDELDDSKLKSLARIGRIRDTWPTPEIRDEALKQYKTLGMASSSASAKGSGDEIFYVDNELSISSADDCPNSTSRGIYSSLQKLKEQKQQLRTQLDSLRSQYHSAARSARNTLAPRIKQAENDINTLTQNIKTQASKLRESILKSSKK